jgi:hypothetical protein
MPAQFSPDQLKFSQFLSISAGEDDDFGQAEANFVSLLDCPMTIFVS